MKHLAILGALTLVGACTSYPPPNKPATEFTTSVERQLADWEREKTEELSSLCNGDSACIYDQSEARQRLVELEARANPLDRWWSDYFFDFQYALPETRQRGALIRSAVSESRMNNRNRKGQIDYVAAEQWAFEALDLRGVELTEPCLLVDRVTDNGYFCLDNSSKRFVYGTPPK